MGVLKKQENFEVISRELKRRIAVFARGELLFLNSNSEFKELKRVQTLRGG